MSYTVAGFFSGVGGIEYGFQQAGFEILFSNEIDKYASETYRANFGEHTLITEDINKISIDDIPNTDVVVGGFPCQAFSISGFQRGFEDTRGTLFFNLANIIKEKRPRVFLLENVRNLFSHDNGKTWDVINKTLLSFGYRVMPIIINAREYSEIPHNRERIYIVGFREDKDFLNFKGISPVNSQKKLSELIDWENKVDDKYYYNKKGKNYPEIEQKINKKYWVYQFRIRKAAWRDNVRFFSDYCPCLMAVMENKNQVPLIYTEHGIRRLTPRECFRLQGFPDSFILPDILESKLYKQAGNGVCVPVIKNLAESIKNAMKETDESIRDNI